MTRACSRHPLALAAASVCLLGGSALGNAGCDAGYPIEAVETPLAWQTSFSPADGATDVDRNAELHIGLDRRVDPSTAHRASVRLESGPLTVMLSVRVDLVRNEIVARTFDGAPLEPNVSYRITVRDLRDLDGRLLAAKSSAFRTGSATTEPPMPRDVTFADVAPVLRERCGGLGCHGSQGAALGLALDTPEGVRAAVGARSRQLPSRQAAEPERGAFGLGDMPVIDVAVGVGRPATSYLLYKVLGDEHIVGAIMPPEGARLDANEIALLDAWILGGARIP